MFIESMVNVCVCLWAQLSFHEFSNSLSHIYADIAENGQQIYDSILFSVMYPHIFVVQRIVHH